MTDLDFVLFITAVLLIFALGGVYADSYLNDDAHVDARARNHARRVR